MQEIPIEKLVEMYGEPEQIARMGQFDIAKVTIDERGLPVAAEIVPNSTESYIVLGVYHVQEGTQGNAHKVMSQIGINGRQVVHDLNQFGYPGTIGKRGVYKSISALLESDIPCISFCGEMNRENNYKQMPLRFKIINWFKGFKSPGDYPIDLKISVVSPDFTFAKERFMNLFHAVNTVYENNPVEENFEPFTVCWSQINQISTVPVATASFRQVMLKYMET